MDLLDDSYEAYIPHFWKGSENIIKRDTSICYYDCTNYYFEIESSDNYYINEVTGEIIQGLRHMALVKNISWIKMVFL